MAKVMVIAGEVSGDMHAARVVNEIKSRRPNTQFFGMGSAYLENEGVDIVVDPTTISSIGFQEALVNIKKHINHLHIMKKQMRQRQPAVLFLVDYSGFNMLMARMARKYSIPVVDYFPPSAWSWGQWRAGWMARTGAAIAAVFPMERDIYRQAGAEVHFVGHPLLDIIDSEIQQPNIWEKLALDADKPVAALLPGSRRSEIEKLLPEMLKAAFKLQQENRQIQFIIPVAVGISETEIKKMVDQYKVEAALVQGYSRQVMKIADVIVTASGTATLEAAIIQTPMIIIYKTSWTTYKLGQRLINLDYIGLPNIIAGREICPEFLQEEAGADNIYYQLKKLMTNKYLRVQQKRELQQVKQFLGEKGAIARTAELVLAKGALDESI